MFAIPYTGTPLEDVVFTAFTFNKIAAKSSSAIQARVSSPVGTKFMLRGLLCNYPPKPCNMPYNKKGTREGNVITGGYEAWEPLQLSMHLSNPLGPSTAAQDASNAWVSKLVSSIWEQRVSFLEKVPAASKPRSQAVLRDCAKTAAIFTDLVVPRSLAPGACSTLGVDAQIVGHGCSVLKTHLARTSSTKMPERVAWADYAIIPATPPGELECPSTSLTTELFLVVKDASGADACVSQVPWHEDGALLSSSPRMMTDEGEAMWRKVGPQDILQGSIADAECMLMPVSVFTDSMGVVGISKRLVITALFFRVPDVVAPTKVGSYFPTVMAREATEEVFAGMKRARWSAPEEQVFQV